MPPASSPAFVIDGVGEVVLTRPASWHDISPTSAIIPGPLLWLSSQPLSMPCGSLTPGFPIACLPGGALPDDGVLIYFGTGATLAPSAPTPLPITTLASDSCAAAGGRAVGTRIRGTYIEACLRGSLAEAAFEALYRSLH